MPRSNASVELATFQPLFTPPTTLSLDSERCEEDLTELRRAVRLDDAAHLDTGLTHGDEHVADALVLRRIGIGACEEEAVVGVVTTGRPHLLAVDHPFVTVEDRRGLQAALKDAIGRQWQCGTMQVDFSMPQRLGAEYVTESGERATPVMLHRAIVGSLERFIGILVEEHAGALPAWLAPVQLSVLNITDAQSGYAAEVAKTLQKQGLRVEADLRNEKITYKIRQHSLQKVPYILVVGDKEKANGTVAVRARGNRDLGVMALADFSAKIASDIAQRESEQGER